MKKRVILSAGGTGGHLFPAQEVAKALEESCEILFIGGKLTQNQFFQKQRFPFEEIPCATFTFSRPKELLKGSGEVIRGIAKSRKILSRFSPDLVVGFGSYYSLPVMAAALTKRVPLLLHEQNAIPGKVNKLFSRFAKVTAITFPHSASLFNGKTQLVRFPCRKRSFDIDPWHYFGLDKRVKTLFVMGGSQGAQALNKLILWSVLKLDFSFQILHFTGNEEMAAEAKAYYSNRTIAHAVRAFETRVDLALAIADLAITRAGAGTISELIESEKPAILIPFPYATEDHQFENGRHFVEQVKGGEMYREEKLDSFRLAEIIKAFLEKDLEACRENIRSYKEKLQAKELVELILDLL